MVKEYIDCLVDRCGIKKLVEVVLIGVGTACLSMTIAAVVIPDEPVNMLEKENE